MKVALGFLAIAAVIVGLLYTQGMFDPSKVGPDTEVAAPESAGDVAVAEVTTTSVEIWSEAVGTVRSRRTTRVSPRIMGTVLEIRANQGDEVKKGDLLVRLDDREVAARVSAAKADLARAEARLSQAAKAKQRYTELHSKSAATREQLESVVADHDAAAAAVAGAQEAVRVAEIVVGYSEIRAAISGVVTEKLAEPGDLALPGKPLLLVQDPSDLRLEADVREYRIGSLPLKTPVRIVFGPPIDARYDSVVEERAPEADPATRTFLVKAPLPAGAKASPGNFGRLLFRTGEREVVLVPAGAVRRVGQLETVKVLEDDRLTLRHVRTGSAHGDKLEVLAGLVAGEKVALGKD